MENLNELTIKKFHDGLLEKKFSALEVAQAMFARIKTEDEKINAYLSLAQGSAVREAEIVDLAIAQGAEVADLAGVPLAIKDNILIQGLPATAASKMLEHYVASYDAGVIEKLKSAHAVFLGKTNMDEFALGSSTENSAFRTTKNPHDLSRVPGGTSGGSAAAVAADFAVAALGSDTGGSIRQPASFCGIVGLSPTYGSVSRSGVISTASSLDQVGPLTKTVEDAAILFKTIAGRDSLDSTSNSSVDYEKIINPDFTKVKQLTIGLPEEYFIPGTEPATIAAIESAIEKFKSLGISFKKVSLPHTKYALSAYYIINFAEVSSNLARFDGIRYGRNSNGGGRKANLNDIYLKTKGTGFGTESKRRIILGTFVLSSGYYDAYYEKAQRVRALIKQDFDEAFKNVDILLTPVAPTSAFKIGENINDPLAMYLGDVFSVPVKLGGFPAIAIPTKPLAKLTKKELPIGFQLIGKKWHEGDILGMGMLYEKE